MAEGLGWAGKTEAPGPVIILWQRAGQATGLPTRTEQADLRFALHAAHGEFPRIIIAPGDVAECFYDTFDAFNYAERYQVPSQGADYSGGALPLAGANPAGTSLSSSAWPYSKRSTNPPCSVTISNGTVLPTLVEIHGVQVGPLSNDECGTVFSGVCDVSFNICDAILSPNCPSTFPFTMDQAHAEIDMYWTNGGIAPPTPKDGATIDLQGFAYWDDAHVSDAWHDFSGWEIHPVTAWRFSANSPLQASFTFAPSAPNTNQSISFTASPIGGTSPYSYSWEFGDGTTSSIANPTHSYNNAAIFSVILTINDSKGGTTSSSRQITINNTPPPPALTSSFSSLPSSPTTSTAVSFSSQASGGVSPYSFNWSFGDGATGHPVRY